MADNTLFGDVKEFIGVSSIADYFVKKAEYEQKKSWTEGQATIDQLRQGVGALSMQNQQLLNELQGKKDSKTILGANVGALLPYALLAAAAYVVYKLVK